MSTEYTPPFTFEMMETELRRALAVQATQIGHVGSEAAAVAFLGIDLNWTDGFEDDDLAGIDLSRFYVHRWLRRAYDYAFQVGSTHRLDETMMYDLRSFIEGFTPVAAISGEMNPMTRPDSLIMHVVDMALGRWNLDTDGYDNLTIRQLALLTGTTEKSVRNMLSAEKIKTTGTPAGLEVADARKWLEGRRGFVPTKPEHESTPLWREQARQLRRSLDFGSWLSILAQRRGLTHAELAAAAKVEEAWLETLMTDEGEVTIDLDGFARLAGVLNLDLPSFVGQAVEAALQRRPAEA